MHVPHGIVQPLKRTALRCERERSGDTSAGAAGSRCAFAANAMPGMPTATVRARRSSDGWTCEPLALATSAVAGERADTRPASKNGVHVKRNAARHRKK